MIQNHRSLDRTALMALAAAARSGRLASVRGTNSPISFRRQLPTRDSLMTFDAANIDAAGAFLVGELEKLDQRLHMPLAAVTWSRDIDLRTDVSMADEDSSFTNTSFAASQSLPGSNKSWASKTGNAIAEMALDMGKTTAPLPIWAQMLSWTIPELLSAQKLGRPVDQQKFDAMQLKYQMDVDEEVYVGDSALGMNGMLTHASLSNTGNAVTGTWATATPAQILADINSLLNNIWGATGYAIMPDRLLLAPAQYSILVSTLISSAGNISIMEFVKANSLTNASLGRPLDIQPCKWLTGTGVSGSPLAPAATDSMFAYVKDPMRIRIPLVPLQRTPVEYRDIRQITTYFGRIGGVEMVYPDCAGLRSNLR